MKKVVLLLGLVVIMSACNKNAESIKGEWVFSKIVPVETRYSDAEIELINLASSNLQYEFKNDTMYLNGKPSCKYRIDAQKIIVQNENMIQEYWCYIDGDTMSLSNNNLTTVMVRK